MPTRRDFIKALGGALGAGLLTAAGGRSPRPASAAGPPIPSAYSYRALISTGAALPGGQTLSFLPGPVMINDTGKVIFYAKDSSDVMGLYEVDLNDPAQVRKVARSGDTLADGKTLGHLYGMETNTHGTIAMLAYTTDGLHGVYMERNAGGMQPAAAFNQQIPGSGHRFGSHFQDLSLQRDDNLCLVAYYTTEDQGAGRIGLIHLPSGSVNESTRVVMSSPNLVHGQDGYVNDLGLVHVNNNGDYVIQAFQATEGALATAADTGGAARRESVLLKGNLNSSISSMDFATLAWPQFPKPGGPPPSGEIVYGPRISADSQPAYVVHVSDERMSLVLLNRTIISSGDLAPAGWAVSSISPPNASPDGLYFFTLMGFSDNQNVFQLIVHNGYEARVMLSMLDTVGDKRIINLLWGFHTDQTDSAGRLAFVAEWDDESTQSLMLAEPV